MLKLIIFDQDGVIINPKDSYLLAFQKVLEHHGVQVAESEIEPFMGPPTEKVVANLFTAFKIHADVSPWVHFVDSEVTSLSSMGRIDACELDRSSLRLVSKIAPIALITNSDRRFTETIVKAFDLEELFVKEITGDDGFESKEKAIISTLKELSIEPENCVYIGDLPRDVEVAKKAGVKSISFYTKCSWYWGREKEVKDAGADFFVRNFDELITVLSKM